MSGKNGPKMSAQHKSLSIIALTSGLIVNLIKMFVKYIVNTFRRSQTLNTSQKPLAIGSDDMTGKLVADEEKTEKETSKAETSTSSAAIHLKTDCQKNVNNNNNNNTRNNSKMLDTNAAKGAKNEQKNEPKNDKKEWAKNATKNSTEQQNGAKSGDNHSSNKWYPKSLDRENDHHSDSTASGSSAEEDDLFQCGFASEEEETDDTDYQHMCTSSHSKNDLKVHPKRSTGADTEEDELSFNSAFVAQIAQRKSKPAYLQKTGTNTATTTTTTAQQHIPSQSETPFNGHFNDNQNKNHSFVDNNSLDQMRNNINHAMNGIEVTRLQPTMTALNACFTSTPPPPKSRVMCAADSSITRQLFSGVSLSQVSPAMVSMVSSQINGLRAPVIRRKLDRRARRRRLQEFHNFKTKSIPLLFGEEVEEEDDIEIVYEKQHYKNDSNEENHAIDSPQESEPVLMFSIEDEVSHISADSFSSQRASDLCYDNNAKRKSPNSVNNTSHNTSAVNSDEWHKPVANSGVSVGSRSSQLKVCSNALCATTMANKWRWREGQPRCDPCGQYLNLYNVERRLSLVLKGRVQRRRRKPKPNK